MSWAERQALDSAVDRMLEELGAMNSPPRFVSDRERAAYRRSHRHRAESRLDDAREALDELYYAAGCA